jgi:hypothetical protein
MNYCMRNSIVGVLGMGWRRSQRASKRALACFAVLGVGGIAGLAAGFSADSGATSEPSPAEIVALRFPGGASRIAAIHIAPIPIASNAVAAPSAPAEPDPSPGPTGYMLASADESQVSSLMFNPLPTYSSPAYSSPAYSPPAHAIPASAPAPRPPAARQLPPELVTASVELPREALAYATPGADEPPEPVASSARSENVSAAPAPAKRPVPPPRPAAPPSASNAVLNSAQIASIRERLKLTSYQSQLWPPVESALRDISYQGRPDTGGRKLASNAKGGTIDPNSGPVQRLKSAAFPLIMSLSEDQKEEVRTMVRLMGLENLASQF